MAVREQSLANMRVRTSTVFLVLWQRPGETRYRTVGRLSRDSGGYTFNYLRADERDEGFQPLLSLPDSGQTLRSPHLFAVFANRVTQPGRDDLRDYLQRLDIEGSDPEPFELLTRTMGQRETDRILVVPVPIVLDGVLSATFFAHGSRHVDPDRRSITRVSGGDPLCLERELGNVVDPAAVLVLPYGAVGRSAALGYVPRVMAGLVSHALEQGWENAAFAGAVNTDRMMRTSDRLRLLVRLFVRVPDGFNPESWLGE